MCCYVLLVILSVVFTMATALSVADFLRLLFGDTGDAGGVTTVTEANLLSHGLQWVYDSLIGYGPHRALLFFSLLVFILYGLKNVFTYAAAVQINVVRYNVVCDIRNEMYRHSLRLPLSFLSRVRQGDLLSRFSNDVAEYDENILASIQQVLVSSISIVLYLAMLCYISPLLTLVVLLALPIVAFVISGISRKLKHKSKDIQERGASLMATIEETIGGLRVIKSFNTIDISNHKFQQSNREYTQMRTRMFRRIYLASPVSDTLGNIIVVAILLFGSMLILNSMGGLTPEMFVSYLMMFVLMIPPTKELSTAISTMRKGQACANRIVEYLQSDESDEYHDDNHRVALRRPMGEVVFHQVCFSYRQGIEVLHQVSFTITPGTTVALVGSSGGGKSTIADLLTRFYLPTQGFITVGGIPLAQISMVDYRHRVAIVTQQSLLFNDTVANNIAFGLTQAGELPDPVRVRRAAQIANAEEFIEQLPSRYDTMIGEAGSLLSGGQRQRIAIARALYTDPDLIILDEATSALDSESEHEVQVALASALQGRTALVIAHRLATIRHADKILVVEDGTIVEQGSHQQLMSHQGRYAQLVELQKLQEQPVAPLDMHDTSTMAPTTPPREKPPASSLRGLTALILPLLLLTSLVIRAQTHVDTAITLGVENDYTGVVSLHWTRMATTAEYQLMRKIDGVDDYIMFFTTTDTSYSYTLPPSVCTKSVCHYVSCTVGQQQCVSNVACDQFYTTQPTTGVTRFYATVDEASQQIQLRWTPSVDTDIQGYFICSGDPCMSLDTVWDATASAYLVRQYVSTESHAFRLYAFDSCGVASPLTDVARNMVLSIRVNDCDGEATLSWNAYINMPDGLQQYEVQRSVDGAAFTTIATVPTDSVSATVTIPTTAVSVAFRVGARGGGGIVSYSNQVSASFSTADTARYLTITSASVTDDEQAIQVRMQVDPAYHPADGYTLYRRINDGMFSVVAQLEYNIDGVLTYTDRAVAPDAAVYTYRIDCLDGCGRNEQYSNEVTSILLMVETAADGISLQWNSAAPWAQGADYLVWRRVERSEQWERVGTVSATTYHDPIVDFDEPLYYRVHAMGAVDSAQSNSVRVSREMQVFMPNVFTPTLATNNQVCPALSFRSATDYSFAIYDQQGLLVFYSVNPDDCWDGTYQGRLLPQGAYVYLLRYNRGQGMPQVKRGTILLIQ